MLLNAGVCGVNGDIFAVAREVERFSILDLALYSIKASGQRGSIVFKIPHESEGYQSAEFGGTRRTNHANCALHGFIWLRHTMSAYVTGFRLKEQHFLTLKRPTAKSMTSLHSPARYSLLARR